MVHHLQASGDKVGVMNSASFILCLLYAVIELLELENDVRMMSGFVRIMAGL